MTVCALVWASPGCAGDLARYEDDALALLPYHGGVALQRLWGTGEGPDDPTEVHLLRFPSEADLQAYLADPRRAALAERRNKAVARGRLIRLRRSRDHV